MSGGDGARKGGAEAGGGEGKGKDRTGRDAGAKGKPGSGVGSMAETGAGQGFKGIIQDSLNSESTTQTSQSSAGTQPATQASTQPSTQPAKPASIAAFVGYKAARFQKYDATILRLVQDFNARKEFYSGGTAAQAKQIPDLDPNLVKSWIIQETGGSPAAWNSDPAQVNVTNWSHYVNLMLDSSIQFASIMATRKLICRLRSCGLPAKVSGEQRNRQPIDQTGHLTVGKPHSSGIMVAASTAPIIIGHASGIVPLIPTNKPRSSNRHAYAIHTDFRNYIVAVHSSIWPSY